MKRLFIVLLSTGALALSSCGSSDKSSEETGTAGDTTALRGEAEGKIFQNPSGVRYQEMVIGTGKEIKSGSFVEFDYSAWIADASGLTKVDGIGSSVDRPGQSFKAEVGVQPLPGLSDGLIGMRVGGSRRIFIPSKLGFPAGTPFMGQNSIFEAIGIKEITAEEVTHYHDSVAQWFEMARKVRDSVILARKDSLAALGLDSLGQPLDSAATGGR